MIADRLDNWELYAGVSPDIRAGLEHLAGMDESVELGTYFLTERVKVIVSSYETKGPSFAGYEAHRKCIDIQYPTQGREKVLWSPLDGMEMTREYDEIKDRAIWDAPMQSTEVVTGDGVFAIFFPEDAHRPCLPVGADGELIKKITIKVELP